MQLFLEAFDLWLFRDGRPFDALSDHLAESLFPPSPSVIQGAIRSYHLVVKSVDLRDKNKIAETVGTTEDYKDLRLRGPFLARREKGKGVFRYFPQPADAVSFSKEERYKLKPASLPRKIPDNLVTSSPVSCLLGLDDEPAKEVSNLWLTEKELLAYLDGEEVIGTSASELFQKESRFGIGLHGQSRTVKEGALYQVEYIRPSQGVGLLVEIKGYEGWPAVGVLRLGGEGRGAYFQQVEAPAWPAPPEILPFPRFKLYFATPAYFAGGWQPEGGNWSRFFTGEVELVAAALDRYESIGGYDWARHQQKPARRYVPAGSVYYFTAQEKISLAPHLIQNALTDWGAEIGFGQILVKEW